MNKNYTNIIIILLITFISLSCSEFELELNEEEKLFLKENKDLKVAVHPYYPPYQYINQKGEIDGIFIDYLKLIEKKNNYNFKIIIFSDWDKLIESAKKKEIDLILEIQKTKNRENYLHFFKPLFESKNIIVKNKNLNRNNLNFKNLSGLKMILPKDNYIIEVAKKNNPNLNISYGINDLDCLNKINSGDFDVYIGPKAMISYFLNNYNLNNIELESEINEYYSPGFAVTKENKILISIIEKDLNYILDSDEGNAILEKRLFYDVKPYHKKLSFWLAISALTLTLILFLLLINNFLKYKIKQRTKELNIAKEKAEKSDRLKTVFLQNISHEIKTPINAIVGFSEILTTEKDLSLDEQKDYIKIISESSLELVNCITNIIDISKLDLGNYEISNESISINELLERLYELFKNKAIEKKLEFILDNKIDGQNLQIVSDKNKLNKLIFNLLDNAFKFTKEGSITLHCRLEDNKLLIFEVIDTGIGIKKEDKKIIFKNFTQSEKELSKNYGGLGLGLSITKKLAQILGGKISFDSSKNKRTIFTFSLPCNFPSCDLDNEKKSEEHKEVKKKKILIAEDGEINFIYLNTLLSKNKNYKLEILRAENGKIAVEMCKESPIDLVLMDIKMPVMDGYEATKLIKKIKENLPIIAQTAFSTTDDIKKAYNSGCDDFIAKPINKDLLFSVISKYI